MQRDARTLLTEIEVAAREIRIFIKDMNFDEYMEDVRTQKAVAFNYAIIGDALNRLESASPEMAGRIPYLRQIVGFRNVLVHGYVGIRQTRVWQYSEVNLKELQDSIRSLLDELEQTHEARGIAKPEDNTGSSFDPF